MGAVCNRDRRGYKPLPRQSPEPLGAHSRRYDDVYFALPWMHKDLTCALQAGDLFGAALPTAATCGRLCG